LFTKAAIDVLDKAFSHTKSQLTMRYLAVCGFVALAVATQATAKSTDVRGNGDLGIAETRRAFHFAESAYTARNIISAKLYLQNAVNCLAGPHAEGFVAVAGEACAPSGNGAIGDVKDAASVQQLELAFSEARLGLKRTELINLHMHALSAMDYMRWVRTENLAPMRGAQKVGGEIQVAGDEIRLSRLIGAIVERAGKPVGTITDAVVDTESQTIRMVALQPDQLAGGAVALSWSQLNLARSAATHSCCDISVSANALGVTPPFAEEVRAKPFYVDGERNLLGRTVVAADGTHAGEVKDMVIALDSGAIDYIVVTPNASSAKLLALPWSSIADLVSQRDVVLKLDDRQLALAPGLLSK
jgi:sporulation protein YlmC with PRC-barrel domain